MHVPPLHASEYGVTVSAVGPVKVVCNVFAQSTWKFQVANCEFVAPRATTYSGDPAGGGRVPSRDAPSKPPKSGLGTVHCWVAASPTSMLARSSAHTSPPRNAVPVPLNML